MCANQCFNIQSQVSDKHIISTSKVIPIPSTISYAKLTNEYRSFISSINSQDEPNFYYKAC